jgi:hypothetical protein
MVLIVPLNYTVSQQLHSCLSHIVYAKSLFGRSGILLLALDSIVTFGPESLRTHDHILLSRLQSDVELNGG